MQFSKYNKYKDGVNVNINGTSSSSSSTTTIEQPPFRSGVRVIWGQEDSGGDIKESMKIEGNIYVKASSGNDDELGDTDEEKDEWTDAPTEEEDFDFDWDEDTEGGSLYVEKKVKAAEIESATDITAGRHLYINYPHPDHQGEKKCVAELIKTNADAISNLTVKVNNNTTNISTNADGIKTNADEIAKLKASNLTEDDVLKLIRDNQPSKLGAYDQPVVLITGRLRRVSYYTDKWYDGEVITLPQISSIANSHNGGMMTIDLTPAEGFRIQIRGIHCTQEQSGDTTDKVDNPSVRGRSDGAHFFECRTDNIYDAKKVYIREFHQKDGNNDSWGSDYWGGDGGGIKAVWITVIGFIQPL